MSVDHPIILASLDLGSNSFHLLISEWRDGKLHELDRLKDLVQLARAVDDKGQLDAEAMERALTSLQRCRKRLNQYPITYLRVVGTQILRQCRDSDHFLTSAESLIQAPIEIISGDEEASLVYLGVSANLPPQQRAKRLLVLDVGGASTELIVASNSDIDQKVSLELGCVTLANRYFTSQTYILDSSLKESHEYAAQIFLSIKNRTGDKPIELAVGASGTLRVLIDLLRDESESQDSNVIHRHQLQAMIDAMTKTGRMDNAVPENLRWDVLPAGIAILAAFLQVFELDSIEVSKHSIKEGMMLNWLNQRARHNN
ncbi:MAG: hypothetical protein ACRBBW_07470 [Cellvibrionaceae bacterium]